MFDLMPEDVIIKSPHASLAAIADELDRDWISTAQSGKR